MNKYINEICDGCSLPLKEDDDIVVCPECATPQHRECYNKNNSCVNAHRHGEGFVWKPMNKTSDETKKTNDDTLPCPFCGFENETNEHICRRCGKPTASTSQNESFQNSERSFFDIYEDFPKVGEEILSEGDRAQIERVINERARMAAPGMTEEQEKEIVAGHPIKKVMTLIANKALVYVNKFRNIEQGKKLTWNWAAFFFSPFWFFYRRMYKTGIVFLTVRMCIGILLTGPTNEIINITSSISTDSLSSMTEEMYLEIMQNLVPKMIPVYIGIAAIFILSLISGFIADKMYRKKVKSILDSAQNSNSRDEYLIKFLKGSAVNPIAAALAYTVSTFLPNIIASFFM